MPNASLLRSSMGYLVAGATVFAAVVAGMLWTVDRSGRVFDDIVVERNIRRAAIDLLSAMQDAETGQRGFLVTGDRAFLEPYLLAEPRARGLLAELSAQLAARGDADVIAGLPNAVDRVLGTLESSLAVGLAGDLDAARAEVATGEGRREMDEVRETLGSVIAISDSRIAPAIDQQRALLGSVTLAILIAAAAVTALAFGAMRVIAARVRELSEARAELNALNADLEERVNQRTEDLIRANQEVQRFAYIVTHDLRAPLVNIMGFTSELEAAAAPLKAYVLADGAAVGEQDILDARAAAAEDLPEAIEFIRSSARKMDGLINAILKISRDGRRQLRPERIDLAELIEHTTAAVGHQIAEAGGSVETRIDLPSVISDRLSLDQILGNLVDNAIKYAHPGRPLALGIRVEPLGPGYARIEVEDNGRGIAEADLERVFELFRRAGRQDSAGEGIGLAHVRSLARNLGGEVTVRSAEGTGSTFVLRLPRDLRKFIEKTRG